MSTIDYYNRNADAFVEGSVGADMTAHLIKFISHLPKDGKILDLGCGSGRDSLFFIEHGFDVTAVDGSPEMCRRAEKYLGKPVRCLLFEDLDYVEEFDGIWACASLLHVEKGKIGYVLKRVRAALKPGGWVYLSFKYGTEQREIEGRLFSDYTENDLGFLAGFEDIEWWVTGDVRPKRGEEKWLNVLGERK